MSITKSDFFDQMERIQQAYMTWDLPAAAFPLWYAEVNEKGFEIEDLKGGADYFILSPHQYGPNLGQLMDACSKARTERLEKINYKAKQASNYIPSVTQQDIIAIGETHTNPHVRELIQMAKRYTMKKRTPEEFELYKQKHQAIMAKMNGGRP